jgi:hypothetical protein
MPYHFSDALDDPLLFERIESFGGGVDGFTRPSLLAADVSQVMENIIVQDNLRARTRPGTTRLGGEALSANPTQGLVYFDKPATTLSSEAKLLITAIGGVFKIWDGTEWRDDTSYAIADSGFFEAAQGIDKALFTDGSTGLAIFDGATFSMCGTGATDPPLGATILCWHGARMFAAGFNTGESGKESDAICTTAAPLEFGDASWNLTTWSFRVGQGDGDPIKALASMPGNRLAVLKENSCWLVNTVATAESAADYAIDPVAFGNGCVGRRAWVAYGNDLLFMSQDGVRSLRRMQAAADQWELSAPISMPVQPYIDRINWSVSHLIRAVKYNEFALFAVPLDNSETNNAVLVWNGRLNRWLGVWTGDEWTPSEFAVTRFNGVRRLCFGNASGAVAQWLDYAARDLDSTYQDNGAAIATRLHTRVTHFSEPVNDKDAYHGEARFDAGTGVVSITAVADLSEAASWQIDLTDNTVLLPQTLPFTLPDPRPWLSRKGLRGLKQFNELYLKVEQTSGWFDLRNITLSAFLNKLENQ